jgi:hypothetical protein
MTGRPRRWSDLDVVEKAFCAGFVLVGTAILLLTATVAGLAAAWLHS